MPVPEGLAESNLKISHMMHDPISMIQWYGAGWMEVSETEFSVMTSDQVKLALYSPVLNILDCCFCSMPEAQVF